MSITDKILVIPKDLGFPSMVKWQLTNTVDRIDANSRFRVLSLIRSRVHAGNWVFTACSTRFIEEFDVQFKIHPPEFKGSLSDGLKEIERLLLTDTYMGSVVFIVNEQELIPHWNLDDNDKVELLMVWS